LAELVAPSPVKASGHVAAGVPAPGPCSNSPRVGGGDDLHDGQVEGSGEVEVALVVGGHGHDRPGAVTHEHVVGNEDRDRFAVDRVGGERAGEDPGLVLGVGLAVQIGTVAGHGHVGGSTASAGVGGARRSTTSGVPSGQAVAVSASDHRVLGCHHHVGGAEQACRAGW
jgi:hypothetical protein